MFAGYRPLSEEAVGLLKELTEAARAYGGAALRGGRVLLRLRRIGVLPDLTMTTLSDVAPAHGLTAYEAKQMTELAQAVEKGPELEEGLASGKVTVTAVGYGGRILRDDHLASVPPGAPIDAPPVPLETSRKAWVTAVMRRAPGDVRDLVVQRIESARMRETVVPLRLHVAESTRDGFYRARDVASGKARRRLTEGETQGVLVERYLDAEDPERKVPRARRAPDTTGRPGRYVPAAVKRAVLARKRGMCQFPGCRNKCLEMAHDEAYADGGSQEAKNTLALCGRHHWLRDHGIICNRGPAHAPIWYDRLGRRIGENGVPIEPGEEGEEAAPESAPRAPDSPGIGSRRPPGRGPEGSPPQTAPP